MTDTSASLSTLTRTQLPLIVRYLHKLRCSGYTEENIQKEQEWLETYVTSPLQSDWDLSSSGSAKLETSWWVRKEAANCMQAYERYKMFENALVNLPAAY